MPRACHPVEHVAPDFRLGPLIGQNPGVKSSADDGLVAKHRRLNQTPAIIARASLPAHASMLCDDREMFVTLRSCRFTCNGCYPWRNNDRRFWVTLGNSVIDDLAIVRPVCRHRRNVSIDLIEEIWQFGDVTDIIRRQFHRDDFMRIGIDTEMQLAPAPARADAVFLIEPFALAVNLQTRCCRPADAVVLCDQFASVRSSGRHRGGSASCDRGWRCRS